MNQLVDPFAKQRETAATEQAMIEKAALNTSANCPVCGSVMTSVLSRGTPARVCLKHRMCLPVLNES